MSLPIVVRAFVFNPEWKILMTKHKKDAPWVLPGWHLEWTESIHEAMKRELQEEFGISANFFEMDTNEILHHKGKKLHHFPLPISIYELSYKNAEGKDKSRIEYVFLMETSEEIIKTQEEEIADFSWIDVEDILTMKPNIETYDFIIEMLEKILGDEEEE